MTTKQPTCEQRIDEALRSTENDVLRLVEAYQDGTEEVEDLGTLFDYGLSFEYQEAEDGAPDYFRWVLSCGGPSDEFRFFTGADRKPHAIEYRFHDWFDGAGRMIQRGTPLWNALMVYWDTLDDCGVTQEKLEE